MGNDDEMKEEDSKPKSSRAPRRSTRKQPPGPAGDSDTQALVTRSRAMFLRDVEHQLARRELYNLDEEFEKTRRNRSPVVWLSITIFVTAMVVIGVAVTTYIQQRSQRVPVNVSSFQDVNLMELLDRAKQLNDQLNTAQDDLGSVKTAEANDIAAAQRSATNQIELVNNELISDSQKQERIAAIKSQLQAQINQIDARYAPQIKEKQAAVDDAQSKVAAYDTQQVQAAKKQQDILDNQQRLFDIQMQKTVDQYESQIKSLKDQYTAQIASINQHNDQLVDLMKRNQATEIANLIAKYNPTFTTSNLLSILNEPVPSGNDATPAPDTYTKMLVQAGTMSATSISDLQNRMSEISTLISRLQQVPYLNSVPPTLSHIAALNSAIAAGYSQIGNNLASIISARDAQIARLNQNIAQRDAVISNYTHALSSLVDTSRENGYILDARNTSNIAVFVDPLYRVKSGDTGYVFRADDQQIGTIKFTVNDSGISGQVASLVHDDTPMQPFDKILLNLK
jgi:hypothetical protein